MAGGIYARNTKRIEILSSSFINCNGTYAGAIYILAFAGESEETGVIILNPTGATNDNVRSALA